MSRVRSALVGLLIAAPFYWLLIDTTSSPELIAGGAAALIAAATYSAARLEPAGSVAITLRWPAVAARELAKVPGGILVVCGEVIAQTVAPRPRRGVTEAEPFPIGGGDALDRGRQAMAEGFRSFAPDTVVIGVDPDSSRLLLHRLGRER